MHLKEDEDEVLLELNEGEELLDICKAKGTEEFRLWHKKCYSVPCQEIEIGLEWALRLRRFLNEYYVDKQEKQVTDDKNLGKRYKELTKELAEMRNALRFTLSSTVKGFVEENENLIICSEVEGDPGALPRIIVLTPDMVFALKAFINRFY